MRVDLDASVLVALITNDPLTDRGDRFFRNHDVTPIVSDFACAEVSSPLSRRVRTGEIHRDDARAAFASLDDWSLAIAEWINTSPADIGMANGFLRRLELTLRTPDAINIASCRRPSAQLATFDATMARCAEALGIELAPA